jgi:hypothetical protein
MTQVSLHASALSELDATVRSFSRALTAWRGVSQAGAAHCVKSANALVSLRDATFADAAEPAAAGMLGAVVDDADRAMQWLCDATHKLARILRGLDAHSAALARRAADEGPQPLLATMSCAVWAKLVAEAVALLRMDLDDKNQFVELMKAMAQGLQAVDASLLERGAETWLEMPRLDDKCVDLIQAAYDAESAANTSLLAHGTPEQDHESSPSRAQTSPKGSVSPAMAFLLGKGTRKKKPG